MAKKRTTHDTTKSAVSDRETAQYADQSVTTGAGGEVHQTAGGRHTSVDHAAGHSRVR